MSDAAASLTEKLRLAAQADPRASSDIARLLRACKANGDAPKQWTIRWNEAALGLLHDAVGLELVRVRTDGRRTVDIESLARRLGGAARLTSALSAFEPSPANNFGGEWDRLEAQLKTEKARAWLASVRRPTTSPSDDILHVARAIDFTSESPAPIHLSDLGARIGASSKFFRPGERGTRLLADALLFLSGEPSRTPDARAAALERAGLLFSPTAYSVLVCGPLSVGTPPLDFPYGLAQRGKAAMLTLDTLEGAALQPRAQAVLTIENEAPFLAAIKEGLQRNILLVMTGGFPNRAVLALLKAVASSTGAAWMHWGDTDLAGIRIARILEQAVSQPPTFFRCQPEDVRRLKARLIPLSAEATKAIAHDLAANDRAAGTDILRTTLQEGGWLEQEAWEPADDL